MNFQEGEVLLVDKPYGWTSFDVVNKIRWNLKQALKVKKIKVGHAGTLDPLATGLLITFLLGKTTPSFDLETEYNQTFDIDHITPELINEVASGFLGEQTQTAPVYSAKQIDGKRAYLFARAGKEVTIKAHQITISKFTVNTERFPEIDFEIACTKGTYIRSIAQDFGLRLNAGATLIALRRTRSGRFTIDQAASVDQWIQQINPSAESVL